MPTKDPRGRLSPDKRKERRPGPPTQWGPVAGWYDQLVGEAGSEYHRHVVIPGVLRLLGLQVPAGGDKGKLAPERPAVQLAAGRSEGATPRETILDVACGQGVLCRILHQAGAEVTGVDASPELLRIARQRSDPRIRYVQADARDLSALPADHFSAATLVLAVQNIHPLPPLFASIARCLARHAGGERTEAVSPSRGEGILPSRPLASPESAATETAAVRAGGTPAPRLVIVMMHPCFRGPKATAWGWDEQAAVQYRRVDRYLVPRKEPIVTHPGSDPTHYTWSFHRPLQTYVKALRNAGLLIDALEEWPSHKTSEPAAPRAAAENLARKEIPMFLALRAVKALP